MMLAEPVPEPGWSTAEFAREPIEVVVDDDYRSPVVWQIIGCFAWECVTPDAFGREAA